MVLAFSVIFSGVHTFVEATLVAGTEATTAAAAAKEATNAF